MAKRKDDLSEQLIPIKGIAESIYTIRDQRVMLDSDLAVLYGVETKALNRAVKRNPERFPKSFMFQLNASEFEGLRCQDGTSNSRGGRRYMPYVFTEHGAVMLASVLNSPTAIRASIHVVEAFVRLRRIIASNEALARKVEKLGERIDRHDMEISVLFEEIRTLLDPPEEEKPSRKIGFKTSK
jgi:hypothetical protein